MDVYEFVIRFTGDSQLFNCILILDFVNLCIKKNMTSGNVHNKEKGNDIILNTALVKLKL